MKSITELAMNTGETQWSGSSRENYFVDVKFNPEQLKLFAKAIRAEALEEAAKVCDELRHPNGWSAEKTDNWVHGAISCAAAIRGLK